MSIAEGDGGWAGKNLAAWLIEQLAWKAWCVVGKQRICVILDRDFGERLRRLDLSAPIWIEQSPQNDPVIAELWRAKAGDITSFQAVAFDDLLDTIIKHHPDWCELEVVGLPREAAQPVLAEFADGDLAGDDDRFVFTRTD